jgi:protein CpxP
MKNLILLSLFMLSFVFSISAQSAPTKTTKTPAEKATFFADRTKSELGLDDTQRQKVYDAKLDQLTQREAIKTKYNNDNKAGEADFRANNDKFKTTMKSILTPDQYTKWTTKKTGNDGKPATEEKE